MYQPVRNLDPKESLTIKTTNSKSTNEKEQS